MLLVVFKLLVVFTTKAFFNPCKVELVRFCSVMFVALNLNYLTHVADSESRKGPNLVQNKLP